MADEYDRVQIVDRGKSISLNGSSDFFTTTYLPSTTAFNIGFWINPVAKTVDINVAKGTTDTLFMWEDFSPSKGINLAFSKIESEKNISCYIADGLGDGAMIVSPSFGIDWMHIAVTYQYQSVFKVYINGVPVYGYIVGEDTTPQDLDPSHFMVGESAATVLSFGKNVNLNSNYLSGDLSNLVIQNSTTAWSQETVLDLMNRNVIPSGSVWYNFDGNVADQSGQGYDLTLTGTTYSESNPIGIRS